LINETWIPWLLLLHILGAIVAFGPIYAFPLIAGMGAKEPMHAPFATRVSAAISDRVTIPLAVVQLITGLLLVLAAKWDLTAPSGRWIIGALILYVITFGYATTIQRRNVHTVIELMAQPRPADAPPGPPPAVAAIIPSIQRGGMFLTAMVTAIIALMVIKPGI